MLCSEMSALSMQETAPPLTDEDFLQHLDAWEALTTASLKSEFEVVGKTLAAKGGHGNCAAAAEDAPRVFPSDLTALRLLEEKWRVLSTVIKDRLGVTNTRVGDSPPPLLSMMMAQRLCDSPTTENFIACLEGWEVSITPFLQTHAEIIRNTFKGNKDRGDPAITPTGDSVSLPSLLIEGHLTLLRFLEGVKKDIAKIVRESLGEVVRGHFEIDLGFLYDYGVGEIGRIVRSFRAVEAKDLHEHMEAYMDGEDMADDFGLLLKVGADVDGLVEGETALMKAVSRDRQDVAQMLLEAGADLEAKAGSEAGDFPDEDSGEGWFNMDLVDGDTALIAACRQDKWGMIEFLVAEGANVDAKGPIEPGPAREKALVITRERAEGYLDENGPPNNTIEDHEYKMGDSVHALGPLCVRPCGLC
uniref:Uncharacterized protein n=1 Tax=Chromera velia CCMP2878 TaxID=1169474 RepID=A0A0G4HMD5_9ALVE|eukprot:Cvel_29032.t1-p1 / transcript=Cvel_29032.t1 / gene=Cvel_29032 / organism=Chromera_velia_CCMP2878 / gene_product=hypothetical protein / transcript_product=hypothetical protein / location=Cvel_scaffold3912:2810-4054(-) / protein_length=415 / sequence_SO=supercontig / SO=protein_coding / is_pseudo=false